MDALVRKSEACERAIGMYLEAYRAIARNDGPEALHVAGYELREFMNELPRALDVPLASHEQQKERVRGFVELWLSRRNHSKCLSANGWSGQIDDPLRLLLAEAEMFATWVDQQMPTRRVEAGSLIQRLAPTTDPLPRVLERARTDHWSRMLAYFNMCTHHNVDPAAAEFMQYVRELEIFLLEQLDPRTFADQDEIDRLIREVES